MTKMYLKQHIAIEPLFCGWYLWSYLIPPHTAGLFLKNRYLKNMQSFLMSPDLHRTASQDPKLIGGQFMNVSDEHIKTIEKMLAETSLDAAPLINLAQSIEDLNQLLLDEGNGNSLEALYEKVPEALKGCVELVYDHNNFPMINFFERPLYDRFYNEHLQTILLTPLIKDKRTFVLSTPRVCERDEMQLSCSISSTALNMLCDAREHGLEFNKLADELKLTTKETEKLKEFFTENQPVKKETRQYDGEGVRIRYMGHACVLLQTKNISILVDPLISYHQPESEIDRFVLNDLPDVIDYVIFTHNHLDHIAFETLIFLKHKVKQYIFPRSLGGTLLDPDLKIILHQQGYKGLVPLDKMEGIAIADGTIVCFPFLGEHGDLNIQSKAAFYIKLLDKKFVFAADSNNLETALYDYLQDKTGPIDGLFLGMECHGAPLNWIYGPLLTTKVSPAHNQSRRYSGSDAAKGYSLVSALKAKQVYIYAMGQETWLTHIMALDYQADSIQLLESDKLIERCQHNKIQARRLFGKDEWVY